MKKILVLIFFLSGCLSLQSKILGHFKANNVETYKYTGINGEEHDIEVHFPDMEIYEGKRPCVVFFHGGGWSSGDLAQFREMCDYFALRGMVAITANYSMHIAESEAQLDPEESRKTICVIDGKSVIRWVKKNANVIGIDSSKVVAGGASAGGHISVLSMMDEEHNNPTDSLGISTNVKAFLLFCPAFTLSEKDNTPVVNVFKYIDKVFPPSIFFVGETDNWKKASDMLAEDLVENDNELQYWMAKDQGHMFHRSGNWIDVTTKKADEFLVSLGILEGQSPIDDPASGERLVRIDYIKTGSWNWNLQNSPEFQINPNPVGDILHIHSPGDLLTYRIFDMAGEIVKIGKLEEKKLEVHQLRRGLYIMNIEGYKSKLFCKK